MVSGISDKKAKDGYRAIFTSFRGARCEYLRRCARAGDG